MSQFFIGEIIKETRMRLGYTQEDLCIGDLDITTISRIESGSHVPQNSVIKVIFAQMNMRLPMNLVRVTDAEFRRYQLQTDIEECLDDDNNDDARLEQLAEDFKACELPMDEFDEQLYFLVKGILQKRSGGLQKAKDFFFMALRCTIQEFSAEYDFTGRHAMHEKELRSLLELAETEYLLDNTACSERYLKILLDYMVSGLMNAHTRTVMRLQVLARLAMQKEAAGDYHKMLEYAGKGTSFCAEKDMLYLLPELLYLEGRAHAHVKNTDAAKKAFALCFIILEHQGRITELLAKKQEIQKDFFLDIEW